MRQKNMEKNGEKKVMIIPNKIIIHCSATPRGVDYSAADIDKWHRQRGFRGIGYHYVIKLDGRSKGTTHRQGGQRNQGTARSSLGFIC